MKGGPYGYTITEVLIFLAITSALFVLIAGTFSSKQAQTEFSVAARDMESRLQDVINDVSTGFYNNPGNFQCALNAGGEPIISSGSTPLGENDQCIFIGRVAQFDLAGAAGKAYNIYSVVGARQVTTGGTTRDVADFNEANPCAIAAGHLCSTVNNPDNEQIPSGLVLRYMYARDAGAPILIRAVGFFSSFGSFSGGAFQPGSLNVNVVPITALSNAQGAVVTSIAGLNNASLQNPSRGVLLCFDGPSANKYVELKVGGNDKDLSTNLEIRVGTCPVTPNI
jgi:hypothetical protein